MNRGALSPAFAAAARFWDVRPSELLFGRKGQERVLIVTALLCPKVAKLLSELTPVSGLTDEADNQQLRLSAHTYLTKPESKFEPLASVICERPLLNEAEFVQCLLAERPLDDCLAVARINPVLKAYYRQLAVFTVRFCHLWSIAPGTTVDGWRFDRLRQPRYFQHADVGESSLAGVAWNCVYNAVPKVKRGHLDSAKFSARPPIRTITRPTLDQKIEAELRSGIPDGSPEERDVFQACLLAVEDAILSDVESAFFTDGSIRAEMPSSLPLSRRKAPDTGLYHCAVPTGKAMSAGEIEVIIQRASEDISLRFDGSAKCAAAILVSFSTWHVPYELKDGLTISGNWAISNLARRSSYSGSPKLYDAVGNKFYRWFPRSLAGAWDLLNREGFPKRQQIEVYLKSVRAWFTWARVQASLERVCPDAFEFPGILPHLGFHPSLDRGIPPRSYTRVDERIIRRSENWLALFGERIPSESFSQRGFSACGSPGVVKVSMLHGLAKALVELLDRSLPPEVSGALIRYNAVVAANHLIGPVLLDGIRNWPIPLSFNSRLLGNSMYCEREIGGFFADPSYKVRTEQVLNLLKLLLSNRGITTPMEMIEIQATFPALLSLTQSGLAAVPFCAKSIAIALALCPETRPFMGWHASAVRHFTTSTLSAHGFTMAQVERFHHRGLAALHPFAIHRLEPLRPSAEHERMRHTLLQEIGL